MIVLCFNIQGEALGEHADGNNHVLTFSVLEDILDHTKCQVSLVYILVDL